MIAGKGIGETTEGRGRGRERREVRRRTHRLAPGAIGLCMIMILASSFVVVTPTVKAAASTQSPAVAINVDGTDGNPIGQATIQGLIQAPPGSGASGFETVFEANVVDGVAELTQGDLATLDSVSTQWVNDLGASAAAINSPQVFGVVTVTNSSGLYVSGVSLPITPLSIVSGFGGLIQTVAQFGARPAVNNVQVDRAASSSAYGTSAGSLPSPGQCTGFVPSCWVATGEVEDYPSSPGPVPVAFLQDLGGAWGEISFTISGGSNSLFNVGYAAGTGPDVSSATFAAGGTDWLNTVEFGADFPWLSDGDNPGAGYIYIDAQAEAEQWHHYQCVDFDLHTGECVGGYEATNAYLWNAGIVNVQVDNPNNQFPNGNCNGAGLICGNGAQGLPPFWSNLTSSTVWSERLYETVTGTGATSPPGNKIYANAFVDKYADSNTGWISAGMDIGIDVLADLTKVGLALDAASALAGAWTYSTSVAWVQFNGPSGQSVSIYDWVGSTSYSMPSGYGYVPLMGITITGGGGGGCVASGTPILTPQGNIPVQELRSGSAVEEYDLASRSLVAGTLLSANATEVSTLLEINHGWLNVTPTDQPIYIKNATFQGWLTDPQNLTTSDWILDPVNMTWVPVSSIELVQDHTRVYDVRTTGFNVFIANGALMDIKA